MFLKALVYILVLVVMVTALPKHEEEYKNTIDYTRNFYEQFAKKSSNQYQKETRNELEMEDSAERPTRPEIRAKSVKSSRADPKPSIKSPINVRSQNKPMRVNAQRQIRKPTVNAVRRVANPRVNMRRDIDRPKVNKGINIARPNLNMERNIDRPKVNKGRKISRTKVSMGREKTKPRVNMGTINFQIIRFVKFEMYYFYLNFLQDSEVL
jgi:hypothetical protein